MYNQGKPTYYPTQLGQQGAYNPISQQSAYQPANFSNIQSPYVPLKIQSNQADKIRQVDYQKVQPVHEVHHNERPLQVVTLDDMENKWKNKCFHLEYLVYELQVEIQKLKTQQAPIEQNIPKQDDNRLNELIQQNKLLSQRENQLIKDKQQLQDELQEWKNRYKNLEDLFTKQGNKDEEQRALKRQIADLQNQLSDLQLDNKKLGDLNVDLNNQLRDKDYQIQDLNRELDNMAAQADEFNEVQIKVTELSNEAETWKRYFQKKNEEYTRLNEEYSNLLAEHETLKNKEITPVTDTQVTKSVSRSAARQGTSTGPQQIQSSSYQQYQPSQPSQYGQQTQQQQPKPPSTRNK
ncbi:hypothetical protein pb186bvf_010624 [Paramecium bursaria]